MAETVTMERQGPTSDAVRRALRGKRVDLGGLAFQAALLLALLLALAILVTLIADVLATALKVFADRGTTFLTDNLSSLPERAGVGQGIVGSLWLMGFVAVIAFPLGIAAAIYLEEYASDNRFTRFLTASIRNLTGGRSLLSGGLTMSILVLPIVIITSAEAIRAVPQGIREAGFGVGATRWEVVRSHVLPYAAPGVLTGTILALARALGEAAPLLLIGGAPTFFAGGDRGFMETLRGEYTALPAIIFTWSRKSLRAFGDSTSAAIVVLLAVLLLINATAIYLRNRYERKW